MRAKTPLPYGKKIKNTAIILYFYYSIFCQLINIIFIRKHNRHIFTWVVEAGVRYFCTSGNNHQNITYLPTLAINLAIKIF